MATSLNDIGPCGAIQLHLLEFGLFNIIAEQLSARFNELIFKYHSNEVSIDRNLMSLF